MKKISFLFAVVLMCASCVNENSRLDPVGLISSNGASVKMRFEQSMAYNKMVGDLHFDMGADTYTIFVCSDSHITRSTHRNMDYFMAKYRAAAAPKLALHLGDVIDGINNYPCIDSILHFAGQTKEDTVLVAPGNHDLYFKQWDLFRQYFKTGVYWFDTNNGAKKLDLFICLDTGEGTLGVDQMNWLRDLLDAKSKEGYRRIIVYTHTHFWKLDASQGTTSNFALEETYELTTLLARYSVEFVWSGHQHARQSVIFKGVQYLVLDATKDKETGQSYMTVEMGENAIYHYYNYPKAN